MPAATRPTSPTQHTRLLFAALLALVTLVLGACGSGSDDSTAVVSDTPLPATGSSAAVGLAKLLPADTTLISTADVAVLRKDLGLPADADATDLNAGAGHAETTPQELLVTGTTTAFAPSSQVTVDKNAPVFHAIDGTRIKAVARGGLGDPDLVDMVATSQPFDQIKSSLESDGYSEDGGILVPKETDLPSVAEGPHGVVVIAAATDLARATLASKGPSPLVDLFDRVPGPLRTAGTVAADPCAQQLAVGINAKQRGGTLLYVAKDKIDPDQVDAGKLTASPTPSRDPELSFSTPHVSGREATIAFTSSAPIVPLLASQSLNGSPDKPFYSCG